jgi:hypothetical protein
MPIEALVGISLVGLFAFAGLIGALLVAPET